MKLKTFGVIALFVMTLAGVAWVAARAKRVPASQGFTLYMKTTDYLTDGRVIPASTQVRYHKVDGSWKMETTYPNGRVDIGFGQMGRGVFHVDEKNKRLDYVSGISFHDRTEEDLKTDAGYAGEETILGFRTLHFHNLSDVTGEVLDSYLCPTLQNFPVKVVSTQKSGARKVYEVVQVILGEPLFTTADYPVDMKHYNEVHGSDAQPAVQKPK